MKAGSLSDPMLAGNLHLGTISLGRHQATFDALSVQIGKAFLSIPRMCIPWLAGNSNVSEGSFQWSPLPGVQRAVCLLAESPEVSVCAEKQHWPVSRQCSSEILSCIGKRGRETRNIFKLVLPVYHGLGALLCVFGLPEWVPVSLVPIIWHLAIHATPFQSCWPPSLWLVGFGLQCILESPALAQAAPPIREL